MLERVVLSVFSCMFVQTQNHSISVHVKPNIIESQMSQPESHVYVRTCNPNCVCVQTTCTSNRSLCSFAVRSLTSFNLNPNPNSMCLCIIVYNLQLNPKFIPMLSSVPNTKDPKFSSHRVLTVYIVRLNYK